MQIDIIFKIAAVGIIVTIVCQILKKSDRVVIDMVADLFDSVRSIFDLF